MNEQDLIYGKNRTERITSIEVHDGYLYLFIEQLDGSIEKIQKTYYPWMLSPSPIGKYHWSELKGNLHFKYALEFESMNDFNYARRSWKDQGVYSLYNQKEASMIVDGYTYFKGMKHDEVSILSFDLETTTLKHDQNAKILIISNTLRKAGKIIRKLFTFDEYETQGKMLEAWCNWVREVDPSILLGHNINLFDLPYIHFIADRAGIKLRLGRDNSPAQIEPFQSKFRKDASQFYDYYRTKIYGREVIDTFFLSIKYDVGRKYKNYGLKNIISEEGLEAKNRVFYDASKIRINYTIPEEWAKIKAYAEKDADDALSLFDLMAPPFFYMTQSVPKTFQQVIETASGSQLNAIMMRSYLQINHSIPCATEAEKFEGAISFGNAGVYHNCFKIDVTSLYPSIMRHYKVHNPEKDPEKHFIQLVETFTRRRLEHKKLAKSDKYYDDIQNAEKIFINSAYGFLGSTGLHFNYSQGAAFITKTGREILQTSIDWAISKGFQIVNADTDSIAICYPDFKEISEVEQKQLLNEINAMFPELIKFENDGFYKTMIVVKAKNYILYDGKKIKHKGSAIKATTKEPALRNLIKEILQAILDGKKDTLVGIYNSYVREIVDIKDIERWATKKTVTQKILKPSRTNEKKVKSAITHMDLFEGDKVYLFYKENGDLCTIDQFNGEYDRMRLLKKLHMTVQTFASILDVKTLFPNYSLKKNRQLLDHLINGTNNDILEAL